MLNSYVSPGHTVRPKQFTMMLNSCVSHGHTVRPK